jgi:hypothetical protein
MAHDDAGDFAERIAALQPPEGFDPAPTVEEMFTRVFVYHERRRLEPRLRSVWEEGYLDLYVGEASSPHPGQHRSFAAAAEAQLGDVLMVEAVGWKHGVRLYERPPVRWLLIARVAAIVPTRTGLRALLTAHRVMRDVPREGLPTGVEKALHASANARPFLACVTAVLHPALAPERG